MSDSDHEPTAPAVARPPPAWIPIRSLTAHHRDEVLAHLLALGERDRYLRFGFPATDEQIRRYVEGLDFDRDEVFGVFNRKLEIVALAHVAYPDREAGDTHPAEFGGSVLPHLRGLGIGTKLFEHAMLHVRNRGLSTMYIHALSENTAMLHIAARAGATVEHSGGESDAFLRLPQDTLASHAEALVGESAAAIDYGLKQQARLVGALLELFGDAKPPEGDSGRAASE
jgi:RimJ/RimL family protein N-acetyltransferase